MSDHIPNAANWPQDLREELRLFFVVLGPDPAAERIREASHTLSPEARLYLGHCGADDEEAGALSPIARLADDTPSAG